MKCINKVEEIFHLRRTFAVIRTFKIEYLSKVINTINIQSSVEKKNNGTSLFLDIKIYKQLGVKLKISVYRKSKLKNRYLDYNSKSLT